MLQDQGEISSSGDETLRVRYLCFSIFNAIVKWICSFSGDMQFFIEDLPFFAAGMQFLVSSSPPANPLLCNKDSNTCADTFVDDFL